MEVFPGMVHLEHGAGRLMPKSPIAWVGGKQKVAAKLVRIMPEHDVYVEPFAGGAHVFFKKSLAPEGNVIADANRNLARFYGLGRRKGALKSCGVPSRAGIVKIKEKYARGGTLTPCEFLVLDKATYGSNMKDVIPVGSAHGGQVRSRVHGAVSRHGDWGSKLRKARVVGGDFRAVMKRFDGARTLHYIDPPYDIEQSHNIKHYGRKHAQVKPAEVYKAARRAKGFVIVSYNFTPTVEKLFCRRGSGFRCHRLKTKYHVGWTGSRRDLARAPARELVIVNFDRDGKRLGRGDGKRSGGRRKRRARRRR